MYQQSFVHSLCEGRGEVFWSWLVPEVEADQFSGLGTGAIPPTNPFFCIEPRCMFYEARSVFWYALVLVCHWGIDTLHAYAQFYSVSELKICVVDIEPWQWQWQCDSILLSVSEFWAVVQSLFSAETLPVFPQVWLSVYGASLLSSCRDGIFIRELTLQHREVGWHTLPILEGTDL